MPPGDLEAWLAEDAADEDVTSRALIPEGTGARATVFAREELVLAGTGPARAVLERVDADVAVSLEDGARVDEDEVVLEAEGSAHKVLAVERTAVNLLAHLSGIATSTADVVDRVDELDADCRVLATRKTTPGLRALEHEAVRAGGGAPHRGDLAGSILVKENHLAFVTVEEAVEAARSNAEGTFVMVEAETPDEARAVARAGADGVLLDNFEPEGLGDLVELLKRIEPGLVVEASGGITADTVAGYAAHVDRVSLGAITHSAPAADLSMQIEHA